jgi:hypothetical protein
MRTRLKLNPGQRGTKKLLAQYGDQLVCVRYRYDAEQKKRFKTVELIVDEIAWEPKARRIAGDTLVRIRVTLPEVEVRRQVKQVGGRWDPKRRVWELRYDRVIALGLEARIVEEGGGKVVRSGSLAPIREKGRSRP